jgi:hypothetical protein
VRIDTDLVVVTAETDMAMRPARTDTTVLPQPPVLEALVAMADLVPASLMTTATLCSPVPRSARLRSRRLARAELMGSQEQTVVHMVAMERSAS